jgi:acyl-CoA dehydrogenase
MEILNEYVGFFSGIETWAVWTGIVLVFLILGYTGAKLWIWAVAGLVVLAGFAAPLWLTITFVVLALIFNIPPIRRALVSSPIMKALDALKILPAISETEQTAIDAGTVWVEGEFFSGKPDLKRISREAYPDLTEKEKEFVDGPVEELCSMVSDWEVFQRKDFDEKTWNYLREKRFFGLIIPEEYGGYGFSANAHSDCRQTGIPVRTAGYHGYGSQFIGAGRTADALRYRGAERSLPATPGQGRRDALFCADRTQCRIGCRRHAEPR